jgi:glycosyltransferase involved in cell wall biosynthesis
MSTSSALKKRVLIFIVAYEAESTLANVLSKIPAEIGGMDVEVLVIDDCSQDRTFEVGLYKGAAINHPVTVLCNAANQGYGGNQKLGYAYALRHSFDFVVLLHGDGQYAPECIPDMLAPLIDDSADAVFGSRMMVSGAARRGGMPLYKFVGNKILTWLQNRLLGTRLSEFHSGYRAYRVSALGQIPFEYNSNVFHFDTEIIIQLLLAKFRIVEIPIPTYYGNEICRVEGLKYAKDVVTATIASRLHGINIFYDRKFDVGARTNRRYQLKLGFASSHSMALDAVREGAKVLDVGCGPGDFARELLKKKCVIDGADQFAPLEPSPFREFIRWKEPEPLNVDLRGYDYILLLDIIEHLNEPEHFLDGLRRAARSPHQRPRLIVTTGNVVFWAVRFQALIGNFNYGRRGILDLTHTRLYTFKSLRQLFEQCGFRIEKMEGVPAPFPLVFGLNRLGRVLVKLNSFLIRMSRGLFAYQIFLTTSPLPTVEALLDDSIAASASKAEELKIRSADLPAAAESESP